MGKKSFFKTIFWVLTCLFGILLIGMCCLVLAGRFIDPQFPIFMAVYFIITFIFITAILVALAVFTYKDALKRGMDPWMWMTIVVFLPNLIGLIIYLIVRKSNTNNENRCINCKKVVSSEFKLCPYCGTELNVHCPSCGKEVSTEWNLCPHCSFNLKSTTL